MCILVTSYTFSTPAFVTTIYWHEIPFLRICIPFIAGILTWQTYMHSWLLLAGVAGTGLCAALAWSVRPVYQRQFLRTCTLAGLTFTLGIVVRQQAEPSEITISQVAGKHGVWHAVVTSTERTAYGSKAVVAIQNDLLVISYIRDTTRRALPGDTLIFSGSIEPIPGPKNPFVFDVAKYYRGQGIHLRTFIDSADMHLVLPSRHLNLFRQSAIARSHLSAVIDRYVADRETNGVLHAMTIGVRNGLDDRLYEAYAKSGAIHILAISGLHVGIISFLLYLLIGKTKQDARWQVKLIKSILLLGGIWTFAFVAGLSPSITRAALMFSLYLTGMILRRPVRGLNILACTACICLCADPLQINALSFQFSYLALAGILVFYQPVNKLVRPRYAVTRFIWGTIAMSVAAQLFLVPFMIYYFQQISLISVLSGVIAIPAAYCILGSGILLFILHCISPVVAGWWGSAIDMLIGAVNSSMVWMSELSWSAISGLYLPGVPVAILSCMTICGAVYLLTRTRQWLYLSVVFATTFGVLLAIDVHRSTRNEMFAIYDDEEELCVDYICTNTCYTSFDISGKSTYTAKEISAFRNYARIRDINPMRLTSSNSGIRLITLPGNAQISDNSKLRIAVMDHFDAAETDAILTSTKPDWIILRNSLKPWERNSATDFFSGSEIQVHDMRTEGSFYLTKPQTTQLHETTWQNIKG